MDFPFDGPPNERTGRDIVPPRDPTILPDMLGGGRDEEVDEWVGERGERSTLLSPRLSSSHTYT